MVIVLHYISLCSNIFIPQINIKNCKMPFIVENKGNVYILQQITIRIMLHIHIANQPAFENKSSLRIALLKAVSKTNIHCQAAFEGIHRVCGIQPTNHVKQLLVFHRIPPRTSRLDTIGIFDLLRRSLCAIKVPRERHRKHCIRISLAVLRCHALIGLRSAS